MSYSNYYAASGLFHGSMSSVMGTQFDILMVGSDPRLLGAVWEKVESEVRRLDKMLNRFDPESEVSFVNREAGHYPVTVGEELWNILQKRNFRYSSVSNTSLSSNVVFSQRVRTFDDALESSQINCVDGSVLFASLLRAINIDPILVRTPGHMFVGYYTDNSHTDMNFLETTMIGDVDLDDFFPDEQLDSTMVGKSQNEMSLLTFEKSKQYANKKYKENEEGIHSGKLNYMFLEISKEVRRKIQPIGK